MWKEMLGRRRRVRDATEGIPAEQATRAGAVAVVVVMAVSKQRDIERGRQAD